MTQVHVLRVCVTLQCKADLLNRADGCLLQASTLSATRPDAYHMCA